MWTDFTVYSIGDQMGEDYQKLLKDGAWREKRKGEVEQSIERLQSELVKLNSHG